MLVLTRRLDEAIVVGDEIVVTVLAVEGDRVKLGIQAPARLKILRRELCEAVREQNLAAARSAGLTPAHPDAELTEALAGLRQLLGLTPPPGPTPRQENS